MQQCSYIFSFLNLENHDHHYKNSSKRSVIPLSTNMSAVEQQQEAEQQQEVPGLEPVLQEEEEEALTYTGW